MKYKLVLIVSIYFFLIACSSITTSKINKLNKNMDYLFGTHAEYQEFFNVLQINIKNNNKEKVANAINYPININDCKKSTDICKTIFIIKNQRELIKNYNKIITNEIKISVASQKYENLFANWQGIMIGNGNIWFSGICLTKDCKKIKVLITSISHNTKVLSEE